MPKSCSAARKFVPAGGELIGWGEGITPMLAERLETEIEYAGYIARQDRMIRDVARHEKTLIPEDFCYENLTGLTLEAREKLSRIRPKNLGQAGASGRVALGCGTTEHCTGGAPSQSLTRQLPQRGNQDLLKRGRNHGTTGTV